MKHTVYHVYHSNKVIAHSLSEDELIRKINEDKIKLDEYEILRLTTDVERGTEQSY